MGMKAKLRAVILSSIGVAALSTVCLAVDGTDGSTLGSTADEAWRFNDPASVVKEWSAPAATDQAVLDINFDDATWPLTWPEAMTAKDCPEYADGCYINAELTAPVVGSQVEWPILFKNCAFMTRKAYGNKGGSTCAFYRMYYSGTSSPEKVTYNSKDYYNNWTTDGHTTHLEDDITVDANGKPTGGHAGFVQLCRGKDATHTSNAELFGWVEIDHIPHVGLLQWSWSSTSTGRGIKSFYRIGNGKWQPLVWMGNDMKSKGYTMFSDQGYFMEHRLDADDVSLRWQVWDCDETNPQQQPGAGFRSTRTDEQWVQAPRLHKIKVFSTTAAGLPTAAQATATANASDKGDIGEATDLEHFLPSDDAASPDAEATPRLMTVGQSAAADYKTIAEAVADIEEGQRGIIFLEPGTYPRTQLGEKGGANKFVSLLGGDAATTKISNNLKRASSGTPTYLDCAALAVFYKRFVAQNITIENTATDQGQAEALYTEGDAHTFVGCQLLSHQDTYKANVGARGYFRSCLVAGDVDFVYDGGLEWFEDCELRSLGAGAVTAASTAGVTLDPTFLPALTEPVRAGLVFNNCRLTAAEGVTNGACYLGRPWGPNCGTAFLNCTLGQHINAAGWKDMESNLSSASYYEVGSKTPDGNAANVAGRNAAAGTFTPAQLTGAFNLATLFKTANRQEPFDPEAVATPLPAPAEFMTAPDGTVAWEAVPGAAGYLIYEDGAAVKLTADLKHKPSAGKSVSVATVSRRGIASKPMVTSEHERPLAFPGAVGFGKYASGGRGGKVAHVTSVADDGSAGTLRWAFEQHTGEPLTIVFDVSGVIKLLTELKVKRDNWTLAGQTAPGEGILVGGNKVNFGGSNNFIVRGMRFRSGGYDAAGNTLADNACAAENCSLFIFDHCCFGWSVEENMNTQDAHFLTVQNCIVHEGLYDAHHNKGARSYGAQWGGSPATYYHNLLASNVSRSPRLNGARGEDFCVFVEYVNNVNWNYGKRASCYGGENTANISEYNGKNSAHECNFYGNYYKPGPASPASEVAFVQASKARDGATSWGPSQWYISGNVCEGAAFAAANADNWQAVEVEGYTQAQAKQSERIVPANAWWKWTPVGVEGAYAPEVYMLPLTETAEQAYETVRKVAGTMNRDQVERRIVSEMEAGRCQYQRAAMSTKGLNKAGTASDTGPGILDSETECEGFYEYAAATAVTDHDGDGLPDAWETAHGLNAANASDASQPGASGYTHLEEYLNGIISTAEREVLGGLRTVSAGQPTEGAPAVVGYDRNSGELRLAPWAVGSALTVTSLDGRTLWATTTAATSVRLGGGVRGLAVVSVGGRGRLMAL